MLARSLGLPVELLATRPSHIEDGADSPRFNPFDDGLRSQSKTRECYAYLQTYLLGSWKASARGRHGPLDFDLIWNSSGAFSGASVRGFVVRNSLPVVATPSTQYLEFLDYLSNSRHSGTSSKHSGERGRSQMDVTLPSAYGVIAPYMVYQHIRAQRQTIARHSYALMG